MTTEITWEPETEAAYEQGREDVAREVVELLTIEDSPGFCEAANLIAKKYGTD